MSDEKNNFFQEVLNDFTLNITDRIFLMIENDEELMRRYLELRDQYGNTINNELGKKIKEYYELENLEEVDAKSKIIKTYMKHKK